MRHPLFCVVLLLSSALVSLVHANTPQNMTPGEIARLPAYCVDTQGMGPNNGTPSAPTSLLFTLFVSLFSP